MKLIYICKWFNAFQLHSKTEYIHVVARPQSDLLCQVVKNLNVILRQYNGTIDEETGVKTRSFRISELQCSYRNNYPVSQVGDRREIP